MGNYKKKLSEYDEKTTIISGGCRGADTIAVHIAKKLGMETEVYEAEWNKYGSAAGPIRNKKMLVEGAPDLVIAFHPNLDESRGTKNMIDLARRAGVKFIVIGSEISC